jgi:hypothetical protein
MPRRRLRPSEIREAQEVFGSELPYGQVWVHEHARWPNWLGALGAALARLPPPAGGNAVTLGWSCYFPQPLHTQDVDFEQGLYGDMGWLIHELTHVWQYNHTGYRYAVVAVTKRVRLGPGVYGYGGEDGLRQAFQRHASLSDFNPEQQGDIARDSYLRKKVGSSTAAWEPFIAELRAG